MSSERDLGRLEAGLSNIEKLMDRAEQSRKQLYDKVDAVDTKVTLMEHQITQLSMGLNEIRPTVAEYVKMKEQVRGAGALGRGLWLIGGFILGIALWVYQNVEYFFPRR
jgi:septal ring factor EnvC (AmiA/AmiB activator)